MSDTEVGFSAEVGPLSASGSAKIKDKLFDNMPVNPWFLTLDCAATFFFSFCFFTIGTISRALAFGANWVGMCAIAGATSACYLLSSVSMGGTNMPHFDILSVLLSLRFVGLKSFRKNELHVPREGRQTASAVISVKTSKTFSQNGYGMDIMTAFWMIVVLFAAGFASAGICRLVLDSDYSNAEIVIQDASFNAGEAFFVELFGVFFQGFIALQLPLNGVHPVNTAIALGLVSLGFQAFGFNVSSGCFNFVRWLSTNAVAGSSAWSNASWVWPVAVVVGGAAIWFVSALMSWIIKQGQRYAEKSTRYQRA